MPQNDDGGDGVYSTSNAGMFIKITWSFDWMHFKLHTNQFLTYVLLLFLWLHDKDWFDCLGKLETIYYRLTILFRHLFNLPLSFQRRWAKPTDWQLKEAAICQLQGMTVFMFKTVYKSWSLPTSKFCIGWVIILK